MKTICLNFKRTALVSLLLSLNVPFTTMVSAQTVDSDKAVFYISPTGLDTQQGTAEHPLRSVHKAQQLAEPFAGKKTLHFVFMDGVHYLDSCIVIKPSLSGSADHPVVYRAQHKGKAVISGGKNLMLKWVKGRHGVYHASLKNVSVDTMDQLYVNGQRKAMARYPNRNGKNVFDAWDLSHSIKPDSVSDMFNPDRVSRWKHPNGAFIHAMHASLWGDMHWIVTGMKDGKLCYEGGWQNNRPSPMHPVYRMIENVFEELDEPGEWFFNPSTKVLYYMPEDGERMDKAVVECVRLDELIRFQGSRSETVSHTSVQDLVFRHAARTFMENREPLLRSDWTTCRKGAVTYQGAVKCAMKGCEFDQVGGNAVFVDGYNRELLFRECYIHDSGANGIAFVGDPSSVRSPLFRYGDQHYAEIDRTPGPKNNLYPAYCNVEECLLTRTGRVEKQTAPVQISMAYGITVNHCSIYDVPRAGINISEGTFGGHVIEYCDVFNTVLETGDHGSFNSWGRDRFWTPDIKTVVDEVNKDAALNALDMLAPNVIRYSRWRCDHGWDIDLDDGSSHYRLYNNLLLNGGLKFREGYDRIATNNIIVNNSLHGHVWYSESGDVFKHNIVFNTYNLIGMDIAMPDNGKWGKDIDYNFFATNGSDVKLYVEHGCDMHSLVGDAMFVDCKSGDFSVKDESPALKIGFRNFDMKNVGVTLPWLRSIARTPEIPEVLLQHSTNGGGMRMWHAAKVKNVETLGEQSATGLKNRNGVLVVSVAKKSELELAGLRINDVILSVNNQEIASMDDLFEAEKQEHGGGLELKVWRNQQVKVFQIRFF